MPQRGSATRGQSAEPFRRTLKRARRILTEWGGRNFADYPWRSERTPFHALIAEVLLQRTRAEQVIPIFREFKERFPAACDLGRSPESMIRAVIKPLGLPWRAKFLKRLGQELEYRGEIPSETAELESLPGIGPYAANAYMSFHAGKRGVLLDSNIVRFYGRLVGLATGPETRRTRLFREIGEVATPSRGSKSYNYALLDFTRALCTPRPNCGQCQLQHVCRYGQRHALVTRDAAARRRSYRKGTHG